MRSLCGVDDGLVARWSESCVQLMPHGGSAVVKALVKALVEAGLTESTGEASGSLSGKRFQAAGDEIEAMMLDALARAASPLAVDPLLDQPRLWRGVPGREPDERDMILNRLIEPPLVVAAGPVNVGKSTLVNALAGRCVAVVADEPGTTRDHVGVMLDLGGLVVRYVDTPGHREGGDEVERAAMRLAEPVLAGADLVLVCGDASGSVGQTEHLEGLWVGCGDILRVALRLDLGRGSWAEASDIVVSARTGEGLSDLAAAVQQRLVPAELLRDGRPWRFW